MPNYEYECTTCGYHFERSQGINDPPLKKCPECGEKVRRLISGGGGVIFSAKGGSASDRKGSGFHTTDYPKSGTCCSTDQQCDQPKRCCGK